MATLRPALASVELKYLGLPAGVYELRDLSRVQRILAAHPDDSIAQVVGFSDSAFWELGDMGGLVYLTDILVGVRATVNIVIFPSCRRGTFRRVAAAGPCSEMLRYMIRVYNLARIQACISVDNTLSNRLARTLGMQLEGVMRDYGYVQSVLKDFNLYSLTREEVK